MNAKPTTIALLAAVGLLAFGSPIAAAQEPTDPALDRLQSEVVAFLDALGRGDASSAFNTLLTNSPLLKQEQAVQALVTRAESLRERCGEYRQSERLSARLVGSDLAVLRYLYKCADYPVAWYFVFYRPPARSGMGADSASPWRVISVRFDTELESLGR
jgi:hypothetical protein